MAVIGRQKSYWYLAAQAAMLASISALPSTKNSLTSGRGCCCRMRDRAWANTAMCPGGNSDFGPSAQYSALTFCGVGEVGGVAQGRGDVVVVVSAAR